MQATQLLDRVPPQNLEAEQSTLGSMMIDRSALEKALDILHPEDFYREAHQVIFEALMSLAERDEAVDIITMQEELRGSGKLDAIGGIEYVMTLIDMVPTASNVEYYAHIVEEKAILRRLIDASMQIIGMSHGEVESVDDVVDKSERMIFQVSQRRIGQYFFPISTLSQEAFERIEKQYNEKAKVSGLPTGFHDLDNITSGLQASDLVIVAARPSMGKTAFVLDIARHTAIKEKNAVAVFSLEMSREQLTLRLICSESHVDAHRLRTGYMENRDWPKLADGVGRLYTAPIYIDDTTDCTALQMRSKCRRLKAEHGLSLVVVDYLQLMQSHRRVENRTQEIAEMARALKSLAREMQVPVIACSQLSRAVEQRQDKRPMLSDLRESGSIEAEADLVMFLYRADYYKQKEIILDEEGAPEDRPPVEGAEKDITEIIIGKQRNGPTGMIRLKFLPQYTCFGNLASHMEGR